MKCVTAMSGNGESDIKQMLMTLINAELIVNHAHWVPSNEKFTKYVCGEIPGATLLVSGSKKHNNNNIII
ncbi:hypothetical protein GCM10011357_06500 [Lacimicrobium alkaliphilum]|uniref:Uncharacterized protein n=1 Tax=Lacimicrobium alkaliphilum TaxID=1526571 RepID=A0ABQ1R1Z3_9ALTE|nr:hypothetical protein GCM10011357_06500 [Lacimicrobium alkaliphilum]